MRQHALVRQPEIDLAAVDLHLVIEGHRQSFVPLLPDCGLDRLPLLGGEEQLFIQDPDEAAHGRRPVTLLPSRELITKIGSVLLSDLLDEARGHGVADELTGIDPLLPGFSFLRPVGPPRRLLRDRESERSHHVIDESGGPPSLHGHRLLGVHRLTESERPLLHRLLPRRDDRPPRFDGEVAMKRADELEIVLKHSRKHRLVLRGHLLDLLPDRRLRRQGRFLRRRHCRGVILGYGRARGVGQCILQRGHVDLDRYLPLGSAACQAERDGQAEEEGRAARPMGRVVPSISAPP